VRLDTSNGRITGRDDVGRIRSQTLSESEGNLTIGDGGEQSIIDTSNGRIELVIAD
jgi:hypothetical protein